jgi:hypothetical protein
VVRASADRRAWWTRWRPGVLAWALWVLAMLGVASAVWFAHLLRRVGRPDLVTLDGSGISSMVGALSATTVGAVLASRRPRHAVGWLLLALGLSVAASGVADGYQNYGLLARPGSLPAVSYVAVFNPVTLELMLAWVGLVLLLTPTGSLPSPRWRWWARVAAAAPAVFVLAVALSPKPLDPNFSMVDNPLAVEGLDSALLVANEVALGVTVLALLVAAGSLVVRFRRAAGVERLQLRWVALAAGVVALAAVVVPAALAIGALPVFQWALGFCVAVLPVAIGAAILRYRLYDLDRIISRTLGYALLTVLLGGAYAGVVLGFGQLLGQNSSLVVAGATLALAAVFQPARRRVQDLVDRRFNRHRYDAAATIEAFSLRLRQQVDLDALRAELLAVVDHAVQPTRVSLWLRPAESRGTPGSGGRRGI